MLILEVAFGGVCWVEMLVQLGPRHQRCLRGVSGE